MNLPLLTNSLYVGGLATLLAVGFGLMAAAWMAGLSTKWRNLFLAFAVVSFALPPFLVTNCWLHYLGQTGVWRSWLPLNIASPTGAAWILALMLWPITLLFVLTAWRRLEPAHLEADMGVTGWALALGLLWPLARGAAARAALLTFVLALNNFAVPAILAVTVFPAEIWIRFNTSFDTVGALQLAWPLVVGPLILLAWFARRDVPWPHLQNTVSPGLFRQQLGRAGSAICGLFTLGLCLLAAGLPLFELASSRRTWTELPGALAAGQAAAWNSLWYAFAAASVVLVAALAAIVVRRRKPELRNPSGNDVTQRRRDAETQRSQERLGKHQFLSAPLRLCASALRLLRRSAFLLWLPFLLPGVLLGIALIHLFNRPWSSALYQSAGIVVLAFVIRYAVIGWRTVAHAAAAADPDLVDVACLSGAGRWQMLRHVYWPQIGPQAGAAWYAVFLLCLWDVESMILVVPPGGETLALRIFNLLHYGHNPQVNALCLVLLAVALLPLALWAGWHFGRAWRTGGAALACLALAGCGPQASPDTAPLQSRFFSSVHVFCTRGVGVGQLNKPRSVAVDAADNFYAVDMTGRVQKFSPDGVFQLLWQMPQTSLGKPKGMCRDAQGNIVVIEPHYSRVNIYSPAGKLVAQWGARGTNDGQLSVPRAVAVNSRGEIFVSEYQMAERVQKFSSNVVAGASGTNAWRLSFGRAGEAPGEFNRPEGLCVDSQDRVYVADSCNHRIQVFSSEGKLLRVYGKPGKGKGELSYPYDICVDAAGNQFVCEFGNSRIQVFDAQDQPVEIIGGPGSEPGRFSNPWGVALDSHGNLYVADALNHRVQKLMRP